MSYMIIVRNALFSIININKEMSLLRNLYDYGIDHFYV